MIDSFNLGMSPSGSSEPFN